jgi:hypothetical protein
MIVIKITAYKVLTMIGEIRQLTSSMRRTVERLLGVADIGRTDDMLRELEERLLNDQRLRQRPAILFEAPMRSSLIGPPALKRWVLHECMV